MSTAAPSYSSKFDAGVGQRAQANGHRELRHGLLVLLDFVLLLVGAMMVVTGRFLVWQNRATRADHVSRHLVVALVFAMLVVLCCHWQHLYRKYQLRSQAELVLAICRACGVATAVLMALIYAAHANDISRITVGGMFATAFVIETTWRLLRRQVIAKGVETGDAGRNILIIGSVGPARELASYFASHKHFGYRVVGLLDDVAAPDVVGTISEVRRVVLSMFVDEVIVASPCSPDAVRYVATELAQIGTGLSVVPDRYQSVGLNAEFEPIGEFPRVVLFDMQENSLEVLLKRMLDVFVSSVLLLLSAPTLLAIAAAIRFDSAGSIFYRSERVGKRGRLFSCYKFRTMVSDAEKLREALAHLNERDGAFFKIKNDPRITKIGSFLRKYSLDELPQLWNVLVGDMSLVGPRPALPSEVSVYSPEHVRRMMVVPGITGLWQVEARNNPSFDTYIDLDLKYVDQQNLWLDLKILARTLFVVVAGTGS